MSFSLQVSPGLEYDSDDEGQGIFADFDDVFVENELELLGVNPKTPTEAKPGSDDKVSMLAARYAAGLPLWHDKDCYDHTPGSDDYDDALREN